MTVKNAKMESAIACFHAALKHILDKAERGFQKELSGKTGVKPSVINDIYRERTHGSEATREKLVVALGYSYEDFLSLGRWILSGKKAEDWEKQRKLKIDIPRLDLIPQQVPIIPVEKVKEYAEAGFLFNPDQIKEWTVAIRPSQKAFAVRVMDDSMAPEFAKGDLVIVDPSKSPQPGNYVLALIQDTDLPTIKELQLNGDKVLLVPKNERYPIMDVTDRLDKCWPIKAKHREYIV